jgi:glycine C-acetyltransferase
MLRSQPIHKENLWKITNALQEALKAEGFNIGTTTSCVTPVILKGDVAEATHLTRDLRENYNIFCSIVVYPVVPKDMIMLRLIPTAAHSLEDVKETIAAFQDIKGKLTAGEYKSETLAAFN